MKRFIFFFVLVIVCFVAVVGVFAHAAWLRFPAPNRSFVSFTVEPGEHAASVARRLEEIHVVDHAWLLRLYFSLSGFDRRIQAGTISLKPGMSFSVLSSILSHADSHEVQVTIPEGYTAKQIGETIRVAFPKITEASWNVAVGPSSPLKTREPILADIPKMEGLEGYLFPDTYRFRDDATAETITATMVATLQRRVKSSSIDRDTVILASIIEREVRSPDDMARVADIFKKRLKIGMALQADSTVNYVTGGKSASVSAADLEIKSPYNTYRVAGLPPGPISNPGLAAIEAALHPEPNFYYYFLTSPDGTVHYAKTFEEHLQNRYKFLR